MLMAGLKTGQERARGDILILGLKSPSQSLVTTVLQALDRGLPLGHALDRGYHIHLPLTVDVELTTGWSKRFFSINATRSGKQAKMNACHTCTHLPVPTGFRDRQGKGSPALRLRVSGRHGDQGFRRPVYHFCI